MEKEAVRPLTLRNESGCAYQLLLSVGTEPALEEALGTRGPCDCGVGEFPFE